jgi:monoamine oxidase
MTVKQWLTDICPGGIDSVIAQQLKAHFEGDFGGPIDSMSALHAVYDFSNPDRGFDEDLAVDGGNDSIVDAIVARLPGGTVVFNRPLTAATDNGDGTYTLTLDDAGNPEQVVADIVVLALPFSTLRDVNLAGLGLDARKTNAIQNLGMGINTKITLQFNNPAWEPPYNGESDSNLDISQTFPAHPGQEAPQALLTAFGGEQQALNLAGVVPIHGAAPAGIAGVARDEMEMIFPGAAAAYNGKAEMHNWPEDPWAKGSYAYYKPGQFTAFAGYEAVPHGRVFFAGEHTVRYRFRQTMNGAVVSGYRVAREVGRAVRSL